MALEPITRQEKIIAGQDLTPITRMEKFLKNFGGSGGGGGAQPDLSQTDTTKPDYVKGIIRKESLPDGYPYKEVEAYKITLPDDLSACENVSKYWYKVSDLTPAISEVDEGQIVVSNVDGDETYAIKGMIASSDENGFALGEGHVVVAFVPNYSFMEMTFPNAGIYFYALKGNVWVSEMAWSNETIHPMAPEFMPALTSPNGTKYKLTVADDGTLSAVAQS